ncbi:Brefeldin A-inhibited guanine nucleotide-exchange protein 2 [Cichlidogyrus casuarinus]|uniref:Brefeldin A-inhibited guanine nucleotide-exchange protein 2 n=1 Tax=Cichlidogyrus casuarinus TaxID=1844966 RepID=A0ABD2Q0Q0_9PLAT
MNVVESHTDVKEQAYTDLISKPVTMNGQQLQTTIETEDFIWIYGWMPVLCELLRIINNCKLDVRTRGLTVFFEIVKNYGLSFKPLWWYETFNVVFCVFTQIEPPEEENFIKFTAGKNLPLSGRPLKTDCGMIDGCKLTRVENLKIELLRSTSTLLSVADRTEWLNTTCNHTLYSVVDVYSQFYDQLHGLLFDEIMACLKWCCVQEHEQLARSGTSCLETLILSNGAKFTDEIWACVIEVILNLFKKTVPSELITWRPAPSALNNEAELKNRNKLFLCLLIRCIVQFELIATVDNIIFYSNQSRHEDHLYASLVVPRGLIGVEKRYYVGSGVEPSEMLNGLKNDSQLLGSASLKGLPESVHWLLKPQLQNEPTATIGPSKVVSRAFLVNPVPVAKMAPDGSLKPAKDAMYGRLKGNQLLTIVRYLLESNNFASAFNSNNEQRNILWEAGFKVKAKPNLLKQETHSLSCALRILFLLAKEPPRMEGEEKERLRQEADDLLNETMLKTLEHFMELTVEGQRTSFDPILVLMLVRLCCMEEEERFKKHAKSVYPLLTHLVTTRQLSSFVLHLTECFMFKCGAVFRITCQ